MLRTAFMTIITPLPGPDAPTVAIRRDPPGFTLVEVMIGASLSSFILAGVLTAFVFLGRSGASISNYNDMESQARRALELFAQDTRQASTITWNSKFSVTMVVDTGTVTYSFVDEVSPAATPTCYLSRTDATGTRNMLTGILQIELTPAPNATFERPPFKAYNITATRSQI
ncbi:MAG: hypothetical protein EXS37_17685 [Opitutus sp.]|nr:hypothetical protein [Opitutus sp.]